MKSSETSRDLKGYPEPLTHLCTDLNTADESCIRSQEIALAYGSLLLLENLFARVLTVESNALVCTKHQWCKSSHLYIHDSLVLFPLLLVFLPFEVRSCVLSLVGPGVNVRYTYIKECRYSWCQKAPCLHIQPHFSTHNSGLKVEYLIVKWLQEWLCQMANGKCGTIEDLSKCSFVELG